MGLTEEASRTERYAELALCRALAARDSEARPDNVGDISLLTGLAQVSVARGRLAAAEQLYRRALAIYEQVAQNQIARLNGPETARGRERMRAVLASSTGSVRREYAAVLRALGRPGETTLRGDFG